MLQFVNVETPREEVQVKRMTRPDVEDLAVFSILNKLKWQSLDINRL